jgi:mono/diheme cytochrome c family protein
MFLKTFALLRSVRALVLCLLAIVPLAYCAEPTRSIVPGFERFHGNSSSDSVRGGLLLLSELNCTACHEGPAETPFLAAKKGPRLNELGARIRPQFVRQLLNDPQQAKPGTTMPHLLHAAADSGGANDIESLVHFLASSGKLLDAPPLKSAVRRGEQLFHRVGCVACHDPRREPATTLSTSAPFPKFSQKYSIPSLAKFLQDPLSFRPAGRMPNLNLTDDEARDIASYLLQDLDVPAHMTFKYYEGQWDLLPDFNRLPVKDRGAAAAFDVQIGNPDFFGVRFEGAFRVDVSGDYEFRLGSDDGSRLSIDNQVVVNHDGLHAMEYKTGQVRLTAGMHEFVVDYFEQGGGEELSVDYSGPGVARRALELAVVSRDAKLSKPKLQKFQNFQNFQSNPQLVERGKQLFQSAGCAACHQLDSDGQSPLPSKAKKLVELRGAQGCLSIDPAAGVPQFAFSTAQRSAITAALDSLRNKKTGSPLLSPADQLVHTMTTFNCLACHDRGTMGGPEESRNKHFQTDQPEMGDEGRIPPSLTGVGDKLRNETLQRTIERGAKDRTYMYTRMPGFGERNVGNLASSFSQFDRAVSAPAEPEISLDRKIKNVGRQLVGDKGFSCIKCHTWGDSKASGIQAISLTTMTRRLRSDWFQRYVLDPQKYRPGTRMPAAWPNGQVAFAKLLDGDADLQIHAVWAYLEDGESANPPVGLVTKPIELLPTTEPIVYRNFLDGAGVRGIGVGYPEHVNLAYDAENCRLALLWQGAFLDASMHWTGRGSGFQKPMGDNLLQLPAGVPLFALDSPQATWPQTSGRELGYRFSGYRLDGKRRPIFLYRWNETRVEESFEPIVAGKELAMRRILQLSVLNMANVANMAESYMRAAVAKRIEPAGDGSYLVDGDWRIRIVSPTTKPVVRTSESKQELLVPLAAASEKVEQTVVVLEYRW